MFQDKILILDGAMGTMIQKYKLKEEDFKGDVFSTAHLLYGNNECLNLTRPEIIKAIHKEYIEAGADIIETNTFSANRISQEEYGCSAHAREMALAGARLARQAADEAMACNADEAQARKASDDGEGGEGSKGDKGGEGGEGSKGGRKILVAGSIGPTSKSLTLASDVNDPSYRAYDFDAMAAAYGEQLEAMAEGGIDLVLIETCFDALNTKAVLYAMRRAHIDLPIIISASASDRSGRTLTGQTLEAFYTSVRHGYKGSLAAFGINCSLGAAEMAPLVENISSWAECAVSCYPNAGLPDEMGRYTQSPQEMAEAVAAMARKGLLNIAGGCCGTTPDHIKAIAEALRNLSPREIPEPSDKLRVSGLETYLIDKEINNFCNVGERTNVAGSRKFARLIASGEYDEALQIAANQIDAGAGIIDVNMDDAMLDSTAQMRRFLRHISNDPAVSKAAIMIDSSHWETLLEGLKNAQGKCMVNSISLKEGKAAFIEKALEINALGGAMVVMAFDEEGQATSYQRKIDICSRAYRLLTEAGIPAHDIIFDVNVLSVATGIEEHADYGKDFIEAVRWIKKNLPGALTSGGISNLSFAFRGNNTVREAMHSVFLYHAIEAGLDMAIVNPAMLQIYDSIEPELLKACEDVILNRDPEASEKLTAIATEILKEKEAAKAEGRPVKEKSAPAENVEQRLIDALVGGSRNTLQEDVMECFGKTGRAIDVIEGPLMSGMEKVGELFGAGKMFLPQVVKSAKIMKDAVDILEPYLNSSDETSSQSRPKVVIATVKGDVHDIGKNITSIVLTCNGFEVTDLGVMVDKETILDTAQNIKADIIAVSGLITPSLFQMEEICREMTSRGMTTPLMIGGATTSALHTAVKLSPLYGHVFYGPDASASAVMAKKYIIDPEGFEKQEHEQQEKLREIYMKGRNAEEEKTKMPKTMFTEDRYYKGCLEDIPVQEIPLKEVLPFFDWRTFFAIWGIKSREVAAGGIEIESIRKDAEDVLDGLVCSIRVGVKFYNAVSKGDSIILADKEIPMLRREEKFGKNLSLSDFIAPEEMGFASPFGVFAIAVHGPHSEGCCCAACSNNYDSLLERIVRLTLAEAASAWIDHRIGGASEYKVIKPAAGYSSCPDHSLKQDFLEMIPDADFLKIGLTESYAMKPDSSICGCIFVHKDASYPEIRFISQEAYEEYSAKRGLQPERARELLSHLLK